MRDLLWGQGILEYLFKVLGLDGCKVFNEIFEAKGARQVSLLDFGIALSAKGVPAKQSLRANECLTAHKAIKLAWLLEFRLLIVECHQRAFRCNLLLFTDCAAFTARTLCTACALSTI